MATTLINLEKRRQVFHLDHPAFYLGVFGFHRQIVRTVELNPRNGKKMVRETRKAMPGTLTLLAGEEREGLPDAIASCADVERARKAGKIKLVREAAPEPTSRRRRGSRSSRSSATESSGSSDE